MQAPAERPPPASASPGIEEVRWRFGAFTLSEAQRRLEREGRPVRLGPRSFDLLLQLIRRAGEYVRKDELLSAVWAGVVVEEASVRVHMSTLRKALGEPGEGDGCLEWISNVPLKGYRFNGRVRREALDGGAAVQGRAVEPSFTPLPVRLTELVGRDGDVAGIVQSLASHRLVTLVGAGGIGKTSAAIRAAERYEQAHGARIAFIDLSTLISGDHVVGTVARSLGAAADMPDTIQAIVQCLAERDVLLLVDNCEHVIESLVIPMTSLLAALPRLRVLATSREALRVTGEYVIRLAALAVPGAERLTLEEALRWPSVQLLVERGRAAGAGAFGEAHGCVLARIARQVDGIPLAIELVAARLGAQSVDDLARRLDDHLRLYAFGSRAVFPRHRTLAAALDWSIALLSEGELRLFRRLSVFRSRFDVDLALGLVDGDMDPDEAFDALISLANKSLVSFDSSDAIAPYRLLETTRSYAAMLLSRTDERPMLMKRHAALMLELMKAATAELTVRDERAWSMRYAFHLDDVRFALKACLAEQPDAKMAASLVSASAALWFHVSQVEEYRDGIAAALELVDRQLPEDVETATWLCTALISALLHTGGSMSELAAVSGRALAGARELKVPMLELQARWGRCTHDMFRGEYAVALQEADALLAVAQTWSDPSALNLAHRVSAMANHFCGRFEVSRQHSEASIVMIGGTVHTRASMVGVDPVVAAMAVLCRTLWIQGRAAEALEAARSLVARAQAVGTSVTMCSGLYGACPVAVWTGESDLARTWIHMMKDEAQRKGLVGWLRYAQWYEQGLLPDADEDRGRQVREVAARLPAYDAPRKEMLVTFCPEWIDDDLFERVSQGKAQWCAAEVRRAAGRRCERDGMAREAEAHYRGALETASQQGAASWAWRAALDLARLWVSTGLDARAAQLLAETCEQAGDGAQGRDIERLRQLRRQLAPAATGSRRAAVRGRPARSR